MSNTFKDEMERLKSYHDQKDIELEIQRARSERESRIREMAEAQYRGRMWAKRGWDPGPQDEFSPILTTIVLVNAMALMCYLLYIEFSRMFS